MAESRATSYGSQAWPISDALRDARDLALFTAALDAVLIETADGRVLDANPAAVELFGYSVDEFRTLRAHDLVTSEACSHLDGLIERPETPLRTTLQLTARRKDGTTFEAEARSIRTVVGDETLVFVFVRDVTERETALRDLHTSEERIRTFLENVDDMVYFQGLDGQLAYLNSANEKITGYTLKEFQDDPQLWRKIVHPDDVRVAEEFFAGYPDGVPRFEIDYRLLHKSGEWRWIQSKMVAAYDQDGKIRGYNCIDRDVTERKSFEIALRESEQRYRSVIDRFPNGAMFLCDRDIRYVLAGGEAFRRVGLKPQDLIGKTVRDVFPADVADVVEAHVPKVLNGETIQYTVTFENRVFDNWGVPIRDTNGAIGEFAVITIDVTEQRELEQQLRQAQKMEAIGQLAGGVAHDFNNILTAILGNAELVRSQLDGRMSPDDPIFVGMDQIEHSGQRAATLTRQLLTFSRKQLVHPQRLDPCELLRGFEKMLRRLIREDIELHTHCADDLWRIVGDAGQFEQVIMNLVVNARDAMPEGGRIEVTMENVTLNREYVLRHPEARPGPHVLLRIGDTGVGMDRETQLRIFEPFFTTKRSGEGTGLGLATVHGIVRQAGGHITIDSRVGRGTTFHVFLPATLEDVETLEAAAPQKPTVGGNETILVCEDDDAVRILTTRTLQSRGYRVLDASDAAHALQLAREHRGPLNLLLTDVVMPGMNGRQLADALASRFASLRVLFVSGYAMDIVGRHGVVGEEVHFLEKPFTAPDLLRKVRAVLDEN